MDSNFVVDLIYSGSVEVLRLLAGSFIGLFALVAVRSKFFRQTAALANFFEQSMKKIVKT